MSRNEKNFKNPPVKFLLKTMFKSSSINNNKFNLSPLNLKNNSNLANNEYISFYTNESTNKSNKSNKKNLNQTKFNCLFRNNSMNKKNTINNHSKKMTRNNSNEKNITLNKINIKRCSLNSKTNTNSLNISNNFTKKYKTKEKKTNKILKLFIKEGDKNSSKSKINNSKGNISKKLIKNKSINNIHIKRDKNIFNLKNITNINNISNITIKNNKKSKNNNYSHAYINKNYYTSNNSSGINSLLHSSKHKIKNLSITIKNIDNNINNSNLFNVNTYTNSNISKNIHKKINMHKTCINTPIESFRKTEQIIQLNKEIESKEKEINNLKDKINEKDVYIKNLENKISSLNINKNVDEEYEKYSKIIMLKNVKSLTKENEELHKQLSEYKNKEIKMMKLLDNMNKKGIDINNILKILDKEENNTLNNNISNIDDINNNSGLNTNERIIKYDEIVLKTDTTNNTNNTNNTFVPLNLNDEQKNISSKSCINLNQNLPILPLKHINEYFNDNYYVQKENENNNIQIQITNNYDCNIIRNNDNNQG